MMNKWLKRFLKGIELHHQGNMHLHPTAQLARNCILNASQGKIKLGKNTRIGNGTEIVAGKKGVTIKEYTTLYSNCKIIGEVTLERYSTLAPNIYISSGNHIAFTHPERLIKKQDQRARLNGKTVGQPVHIHEDVWIGTGAFIAAGITVGRGAIIGANAVVTKDVPPYTVVGGVPAKKIKQRLSFAPPKNINCNNNAHLPYFYQGYNHWENLHDIEQKGIKIIDKNQLWISPVQSEYQIKLTSKVNQTIQIHLNNQPTELAVFSNKETYSFCFPTLLIHTVVILTIDAIPHSLRIKEIYERAN